MPETAPTASVILAELVAQPCVPGAPNGPIANLVTARFMAFGVRVHRTPPPEGDRVNPLVSIGPKDRPGIVLSVCRGV